MQLRLQVALKPPATCFLFYVPGFSPSTTAQPLSALLSNPNDAAPILIQDLNKAEVSGFWSTVQRFNLGSHLLSFCNACLGSGMEWVLSAASQQCEPLLTVLIYPHISASSNGFSPSIHKILNSTVVKEEEHQIHMQRAVQMLPKSRFLL